MFDKLGGRKFILAVAVILLATAIELFTERGITEWYAGLLIGIIGVFGASNVAVTRAAIKATSEDGGEVSESAPQNDALKEAIDQQQAALMEVAESVKMTNSILVAAASAPPATPANQAAVNRASLKY